jgi:hypothetical protein
VQPGETIDFVVKLSLPKPGEFASAIVLYLEDNGIREVTIEVSGTCREE